MSNIFISSIDITDIDSTFRKEYQGYDNFDAKTKDEMRRIAKKYGKLINDNPLRRKELSKEMRNNLEMVMGGCVTTDPNHIVESIESGNGERMIFKGSLNDLINAFNEAGQEKKRPVNIEKTPEMQVPNQEEHHSFTGQEVVVELPKVLMAEHMKDLKRIETLYSVLNELTIEIKQLRAKVAALEK